MLAAGVTSPMGKPLTLKLTKVEPSALLVALDPSAELLDIETTRSAVTSPLRTFTASTVALLWALALLSPIAPVVITVKVFDSSVPVTVTATAVSLTIPPFEGRITSGVLGTVTPARPLTDVFTETPKASPLTLFPS